MKLVRMTRLELREWIRPTLKVWGYSGVKTGLHLLTVQVRADAETLDRFEAVIRALIERSTEQENENA